MAEIGVWTGGSCLRWLRAKPDLTVIGVDLWESNGEYGEYFWTHRDMFWTTIETKASPEQISNQLNSDNGLFLCTISNLWEFRDRFIPVRGRSPEILHEVASLAAEPDVIFLDADKRGREVATCHQIWPSALLCGDDWYWNEANADPSYPIRDPVLEFADKNKLDVRIADATWALIPRSL